MCEKVELAQPGPLDPEVSDVTNELLEKRIMKKDNIRKVECSLLCSLIRRRLKEDLEEYCFRKRVTVTQKEQILKKCTRKLLLNHPAMAALKRG